jgi:hypothetical protein
MNRGRREQAAPVTFRVGDGGFKDALPLAKERALAQPSVRDTAYYYM